MFDIRRFSLSDMTNCGITLRLLSQGAETMEDAAGRIVNYFYDNFRSAETGDRSFPLVRLFKTHPYQELPPDLRRYASRRLGHEPWMPQTKCLTLLATVGRRPEWNSVSASRDHQAIPLTSESMVRAAPMISQLIQQLGLKVSDLIDPRPSQSLIFENARKNFNVFFEADAPNSHFIAAKKDFVIPEGIKSVLGFGGVLPDGELFAVVLFSVHNIPNDVAAMFSTIGLNAKLALMPFGAGVFRRSKLQTEGEDQSQYFLTRQTVLDQLLEEQEGNILAQAERLEREGQELYRRVFDYSNDGILIVSPSDDVIVDANAKMGEMLGYGRAELCARPFSSLHPNDLEDLASFTHLVLLTGSGSTNGLRILTKTGALTPVEVSASRVEIHGQSCIIAIVRDISGRLQAEASARELARVQERHHLARELHDSVTQLLYSATLFAGAGLERTSNGDLSTVHENFRELQAISVLALKEMRLLLYELSPTTLEEKGLHAALEERLEAVERRSGVDARLGVQSDLDVPRPIAERLFRIALEALNNSLKHAEARKVSVVLISNHPGTLNLEIVDDGVGFDPSDRSSGMGLSNIKIRVAEIDGSLTITSQRGAGTRVVVEVPVDARRALGEQ